MAARQRARGWRADELVVEVVFPFPEEAFPDVTTDIWVVYGISEV